MFRNNRACRFQYMFLCKFLYTCPHIEYNRFLYTFEHNNYCKLLCIQFYNCHYIQLRF